MKNFFLNSAFVRSIPIFLFSGVLTSFVIFSSDSSGKTHTQTIIGKVYFSSVDSISIRFQSSQFFCIDFPAKLPWNVNNGFYTFLDDTLSLSFGTYPVHSIHQDLEEVPDTLVCKGIPRDPLIFPDIPLKYLIQGDSLVSLGHFHGLHPLILRLR